MTHAPSGDPPTTGGPRPWTIPTARGPLDASAPLPGSKSLTARALLLAAIADSPTALTGVLRSRDTDLMISALTELGATIDQLDDSGTGLHLTPAPLPLSPAAGADGAAHVDCGLAGTVMRFIPPLAALALTPVVFDGDDAARHRPLAPVLDALSRLGAEITYLGAPGHLPVRVGPAVGLRPGAGSASRPPGRPPRRVDVDAAASSQFLSALLLMGCLLPGGLAVTPTGRVPSRTHVAMTVACLRQRGIVVDEPDETAPEGGRTWMVHEGRPAGGRIVIEPDLSNAGPFLAAALIAGGEVRIPHWPARTTQAGDAWRELLPRLGGRVELTGPADSTLTAHGTGELSGIEADLSAVGELAPTVAALAVLASAQGHSSRLTGIAHLRGHETDRLAALAAEASRVGGLVRETGDGLEIAALPAGRHLTPATLRSYADHRMATFAALIGLGVPGCAVDDVTCTSKTLPGFARMWESLLSPSPSSPTHRDRHLYHTEIGTRDTPTSADTTKDPAEEAR